MPQEPVKWSAEYLSTAAAVYNTLIFVHHHMGCVMWKSAFEQAQNAYSDHPVNSDKIQVFALHSYIL